MLVPVKHFQLCCDGPRCSEAEDLICPPESQGAASEWAIRTARFLNWQVRSLGARKGYSAFCPTCRVEQEA